MRKLIYSLFSLSLCAALLVGCTTTTTTSSFVEVGGSTSSTQGTASGSEGTASQVEIKTDGTITAKNPMEIVPNGNTSLLFNAKSSEYDKQADAKRKEILETKDQKLGSGITYYVSPQGNDTNDGTSPEKAWKTPAAINSNSWAFMPGDAVLFERGGVYRTSSAIFVKAGVSYGAYGEGAKPVLYGSVKNYAQPDLWKPSKKKNVWKMNFSLEDAGIMVFNHGVLVGEKKTGLKSMTKNGDFFHNIEDKILYLYMDNGYPNKVYDDIEIGTKRAIFSLNSNVSNVTIDNLALKYAGTFGVQCIGYNNNVTVKNCEIGWIGGSFLSGTERYGNAVQFWDSCSNADISNNWIYQIYDTGITFQGSVGSIYKDIKFKDNLIEYAAYALEFFIQGGETITKKDGTIQNVAFENNILRFSGWGWTKQRPNMKDVSHVLAWNHYYEDLSNFTIKNNVFDCSTNHIVFWNTSGKPQQGLTVSGNSFYQCKTPNVNMLYGNKTEMAVTNQATLEKAVKQFDKSPKTVKWIG